MIPGQGRTRYLDGLPASELWGVSRGPKEKGAVNSRSEAHRARRRLKKEARAKGWTLKGYEQESALQLRLDAKFATNAR